MSQLSALDSSSPQSPPYAHKLVAGDGPNVEFDEALGSCTPPSPVHTMLQSYGADCVFRYMGIPAMSNRDDGFFSGERHYIAGHSTGFKWQCVE